MNKQQPKYLQICRINNEFENTIVQTKGLPPKGLLGYYNFKTKEFEYNKINKNVVLYSSKIETIIVIYEMYFQLKDLVIELKTLENELNEEILPTPVKTPRKRIYDDTHYNIFKYSNIKNKFKDTHSATIEDVIAYEREKVNREQTRIEKSINGLSRKFNGKSVKS